LEPQLLSANSENDLRKVLGLDDRAGVETWMRNNKTEAALRIFDADATIEMPDYIVQAIDFLR
jgi:hypothetical protein